MGFLSTCDGQYCLSGKLLLKENNEFLVIDSIAC